MYTESAFNGRQGWIQPSQALQGGQVQAGQKVAGQCQDQAAPMELLEWY